MQSGHVTTPFGRRSMTLALVKNQLATAECSPNKTADKWKIFRDVCEAKDIFDLQDRSLAVLHALLSFYPGSTLSNEGSGLVVFPSNAQLSIRAHGIAGTTLRRHLSALVNAGLIERRDSPNGKRYAHRGRGGEIEAAFGFSLAPLLARTAELAAYAQRVAAERLRFKRTREALTLCRRDIRKLISAAMEEGADGDWATMENIFLGLVASLPRSPRHEQIQAVLDKMEKLREEIVNRLEIQLNVGNIDANDIHNGCHIQNSDPDSTHELEPRFGKELDEITARKPQRSAEPLRTFPLALVLKACPQLANYTPTGQIAHWRDLMAAAVVVRSMLGVSPSAYQAACQVMGAENAAIAMACILERAEHINSAGGYLRDLTKKAARGEFGLGPMVMAALKANTADERLRA